MGKFVGYICSLCRTEYAPGEVTYTCPKDGGNLDVVLDYDAIKAKYKPEDILSRHDPSLWRYLPLLPVPVPPGESTPLHAAGGTPVYKYCTCTRFVTTLKPASANLTGLHPRAAKSCAAASSA